jgi:2-(1,2-epoxy-1,2-dihydrophenyl)acetyl-CoA isomerase
MPWGERGLAVDYTGYQDLVVEVADGIARFRIDRPDRLNAFGPHTRPEIFDLTRKLQADDDVRVVVCTAEGRGFCSGADLERSNDGQDRPAPSRADRMDRLGQNAISMMMPSLDKPTIASVNGVAAGGGMAWACSFDIRILGPSARFTTVFVRRAFTPDNGLTYLLPRLIGDARSYELFFTGRDVHAEEALRIGLGNELVEDPDARAMELARELAENAPLSMLWAKRSIQYGRHHTLEELIEYERAAGAHTRDSADRKEGVRAFLEKRKPRFTGV